MVHMTKEQRAIAARRYLNGDLVDAIAAFYRVDRCTIQRLMNRMNVPRRRRGESGKDIQRHRAEEESRRKEIKSVGLEGPFGGAKSGKVTTWLIIDDPVDIADDGALAQIGGTRRRDDLLDSCSEKALGIIRGRSA